MEIQISHEHPAGDAGRELIGLLTADLIARYPGDPREGVGGYDPATALLDPGSDFVVAWRDGQPVGCGALRPITSRTGEIKRMFVQPHSRGSGIAGRILAALEDCARVYGYVDLLLQTGIRQPEAIRLYERSGYSHIACYGEYMDDPVSVCFAKNLPAAEPK